MPSASRQKRPTVEAGFAYSRAPCDCLHASLDLNIGHLRLLVNALQDARHDLARSALVAVLEALAHYVCQALLELYRVGHLRQQRKP